MSFHISGLSRSQFEHLFTLPDEDLKRHGAVRMTATSKPGFPCRVSLVDADVGEPVILVNFEHQPVASPFRSSHAVFVREAANDRQLAPDEVPDLFRVRTLSLRAFDRAGMMTDADHAEGRDLEDAIMRMLADPDVEYLHVHYAKPGCFAARVDRRS